MADLVKCLTQMHEDLSLDPYHIHKKLNVVVYTRISWLGRQRQEGALAGLARLDGLVNFRLSLKDKVGNN